MPASRVPPITLLAGLALRQAVQEISSLDAKLKWPNDVVVRSHGRWKKCAGILTEMSGQLDRTEWVVIGVGLNVNNTISREMSTRAASLYSLTGKVGDRAQFLRAFLKSFHGLYSRYPHAGFEPFRGLYASHYFEPGKAVRLRTAQGIISGKARGVDASGAIMIESRRKITAISEGEIVL